METSKIREASHSGSWYTENPQKLEKQIEGYLKKATIEKQEEILQVKAIIGPHAGFEYSGPTAAWAYQYITPSDNLRVFLLGPCHHACRNNQQFE